MIFDEAVFPFSADSSSPNTSHDFLLDFVSIQTPTIPSANVVPTAASSAAPVSPRSPSTDAAFASFAALPLFTMAIRLLAAPTSLNASVATTTSPARLPATILATVASSPIVAIPSLPVARPVPGPHHMTTCTKAGLVFLVDRLNLSVIISSVSPILKTYRTALQDPNRCQAMADEHHTLLENNTWSLIPRPSGANVVTSKWIFKHKFHPDGSLA